MSSTEIETDPDPFADPRLSTTPQPSPQSETKKDDPAPLDEQMCHKCNHNLSSLHTYYSYDEAEELDAMYVCKKCDCYFYVG